MPTNDFVFVEIAKGLGKCQFIFFDFEENLTAILQNRLREVFSNAALEADDYIKFIPFLTRENFLGLLLKADLYLDTIGFSGFNTALQAISCDLPIVTIEGSFMRGRLASSLLRSLELQEFICKNNADYIDMSIKLVKNREKHQKFKQEIAALKKNLFGNIAPIRELERFLAAQIQGIKLSQ